MKGIGSTPCYHWAERGGASVGASVGYQDSQLRKGRR